MVVLRQMLGRCLFFTRPPKPPRLNPTSGPRATGLPKEQLVLHPRLTQQHQLGHEHWQAAMEEQPSSLQSQRLAHIPVGSLQHPQGRLHLATHHRLGARSRTRLGSVRGRQRVGAPHMIAIQTRRHIKDRTRSHVQARQLVGGCFGARIGIGEDFAVGMGMDAEVTSMMQKIRVPLTCVNLTPSSSINFPRGAFRLRCIFGNFKANGFMDAISLQRPDPFEEHNDWFLSI